MFEAGEDPAESSNGGGLSPDGRKLAFTAKDESGKVLLWVRSLDSLAARPLPATDGAYLPFWSLFDAGLSVPRVTHLMTENDRIEIRAKDRRYRVRARKEYFGK